MERTVKIITKSFAFLAFFIAMHSAYGVKIAEHEILLLSSGAGDKFLHYIINKDEMHSIPEWDGVGEPPLNSEKATSLALSKHKNLYGNIDSKIRKISLSSKEANCNPTKKCPKVLWYYKIKIKGEKRATYVVLIDGSFVEPRIE
jgi:hypothetical protein